MSQIFAQPFYTALDSSGNPISGAKLHFYKAGTTTDATVYQNPGLTTPYSSDPTADSAGRFNAIYLRDADFYKAVLRDASGTDIKTIDVVNPAPTRASPQDFGAKGDGVADDTDALNAFGNHLVSTGAQGFIPKGTYRVREGEWVIQFATAGHKAFPHIDTAGYDTVIQVIAGTTPGPFLTIKNVDYSVSPPANGLFYSGYLGGMRFQDTTGAGSTPARVGLSLRGMIHTRFGFMFGDSLKSHLIYIPYNVVGANPDPYAVGACYFNGAEATFCLGYAVCNDNGVGLNGCTFETLRAIGSSGVIKSAAGLLSIETISSGGSTDWDVNFYYSSTAGTSSRLKIGLAEIDSPRNGIKLEAMEEFEFKALRINHRYNASTSSYWPSTALSLSDTSAHTVRRGEINIIHRFDPDPSTTSSTPLGTLVDGNNSGGISDVVVKNILLYNLDLNLQNGTIVPTANINANSRLKITSDKLTFVGTPPTVTGTFLADVPYVDTLPRELTAVTADSSTSIPNSGWGTAASKLVFPTVRADPFSRWDASNKWYPVPTRGIYRVHGRVMLNAAAGKTLKLGFMLERGGAIAPRAEAAFIAPGGVQSYEVNGLLDELLEGDRIYMVGATNDTAAIPLSVITGQSVDNVWSIQRVAY